MTDDASGRRGRAWSPASYLIGLAIALYVLAAVALFVSNEALANTLSLDAFYALALGVAVRFVEFLVGDRTRAAAAPLTARLRRTTRPLVARGRRLAERVTDRGRRVAKRGLERAAVSYARGGERGNAAARVAGTSAGDGPLAALREGVGLAIPLTAGAGLLLGAWWWFDAATSPSTWYVAGLAVALALLGALYVVLPADR